MTASRITLFISIIIVIGAFFYFDLQQFLTLDRLKSKHQEIEMYYAAHPVLSLFLYALLYIAMTSLSLPGATLLTLAGGAVFGLLWGMIIVSFASSIGATLAFLAARFLFRNSIEKRFADRLQVIDAGINRDGPFYLFTLRLVPLFPFFMINLAMGLTRLRTWTFYWVSQIGMLAGTFVYVNAGTQLGKLNSLSGILSPALIGSFILLGIFPLLAKFLLAKIRTIFMAHAFNESES